MMKTTTRAKVLSQCKKCLSDPNCPAEVKNCCEMLANMCKYKNMELHSCVACCRDVASRCGCRGHLKGTKRGMDEAACCFELCDCLDSFCHQRRSLPDAMRMLGREDADLVCALEGKDVPIIPGTVPYRKPSSLKSKGPRKRVAIVYCANTACDMASHYTHEMRKTKTPNGFDAVVEYPGGALEYACRCEREGYPSLVRRGSGQACSARSVHSMLPFYGCEQGSHP